MSYRVNYSPEAVEDLDKLFDHLLERELTSATDNLCIAVQAVESIRQGCQFLAHSPFSCRKVGQSPFLREWITPFGRLGYVALFEIRDAQEVVIGVIGHQKERDYH